MYLAGMDRKEIAEKVGKKVSAVSTAITRGRALGVIPPLKPKYKPYYINKMMRGNGMKIGTLRSVIDSLMLEQVQWLIVDASRIGCATLAEYITEILRDEYERKRVEGSCSGEQGNQTDRAVVD